MSYSLFRKARPDELAVANSAPVANSVANAVANKDRHKDKEARRVYMRELMRKKRAAEKA